MRRIPELQSSGTLTGSNLSSQMARVSIRKNLLKLLTEAYQQLSSPKMPQMFTGSVVDSVGELSSAVKVSKLHGVRCTNR